MVPRDTGTGAVLEQMILPALEKGGYSYQTQVNIGTRIGGGRHLVDVIAEDKEGHKILISLKWQQVSGTAEQKVPFEIISLADAILHGAANRAYLVLGGSGWKLREYFTGDELEKHLCHAGLVKIVALETFIGQANQGKL